jgi:prophage antirepressor-like protein
MKMQTFNHSLFGEIEIVTIDGKEHFGATQAAMLLGYANPRDALIRHCREDGVVKHDVIDKLGRKQQMNLITEGNLFRLIARSKLPGAEEFEKWVFDDVLPIIRKTGSYQQPQSIEDLIIMQATSMKELRSEVTMLGQSVTTIKETIIQRDEDWRKAINSMFNKAVVHSGTQDFQALRNESYKMLEERARCDLNKRLRNLLDRLEESGATRTQINKTSKMDVIEAEPRLKEIYTSIVKEISIRYVPLGV